MIILSCFCHQGSRVVVPKWAEMSFVSFQNKQAWIYCMASFVESSSNCLLLNNKINVLRGIRLFCGTPGMLVWCVCFIFLNPRRGFYIVIIPLKRQRGGNFQNPWSDPDEMNLDEVPLHRFPSSSLVLFYLTVSFMFHSIRFSFWGWSTVRAGRCAYGGRPNRSHTSAPTSRIFHPSLSWETGACMERSWTGSFSTDRSMSALCWLF